MYPHCLGVMVPALQAEPSAGFGLSNSRAWPGGPMPMLLTPKQAYQREFLGFGLFMCGPAGALFPPQALREVLGVLGIAAPPPPIFSVGEWLRSLRPPRRSPDAGL